MSYHSGNNLIDPKLLFEKVQLREGVHIADFGCGRTGHIVFPASKIVGERGIIYAVDILKDVLESIRRRAAIEAMHNIETIWGDLERPGGIVIAEKTLDIAFFINVLFHFNSYDTPFAEASRILKPKGKIVVLDWIKSISGIGPQEGGLVNFDQIKSWAMYNNFVVEQDFEVGAYHRCVILFRHT
ncbi:MAG: class I SAM-dependent methyltransferase [Candidatus Magasanikbacteria bacterium]|nr:class I SAM-dependent methyltransferase [Candidatus Magasanikbacteria bacterium]